MTQTLLEARLRIRGLTKSYGPVRAVDGVDLDIVAGETVALLGPNGAGKSTTSDALLGLSRPDAGSVTVFGRSPAAAVRAGLVGAMLQSGGLISEVSVRELVELAASLYPAPMPVDEVLDRAGLTELADRRTTKLSGGQTQRVRFALSLVADPELLVLDEPFSGLDPLGIATMTEVVNERAKAGVGVVFSSHQLDLVEDVCEDVVIIARGQIVAAGAIDELKAHSGRRHLEVEVAGSDGAWLDGGGELTVLQRSGDRVKLLVPEDVDLDALLARARAAGEVRTFAYQPPKLSELFMEAVTPTPSPVVEEAR